MADTLRPRLARIEELSKQVNAATDEAGKIVQGVESYLTDVLHIGGRAQVTIEHDEDPEGTWSEKRTLVYGRCGQKFRIFVLHTITINNSYDTYEETPWDNCTRDVKLLAFDHLPALLDEIGENLQSTLEQVKLNSETIRALLPVREKKAVKS